MVPRTAPMTGVGRADVRSPCGLPVLGPDAGQRVGGCPSLVPGGTQGEGRRDAVRPGMPAVGGTALRLPRDDGHAGVRGLSGRRGLMGCRVLLGVERLKAGLSGAVELVLGLDLGLVLGLDLGLGLGLGLGWPAVGLWLRLLFELVLPFLLALVLRESTFMRLVPLVHGLGAVVRRVRGAAWPRRGLDLVAAEQALRHDEDRLHTTVDIALEPDRDAVSAGELRDDEEADAPVLEETRDVDLVRVGEQRVHPVLLGDGHSEAAVLDLDGETGRDGVGAEQDLGVRGREHGGVLDEFGEQVDTVGDGVPAQGPVDRRDKLDP